MATERPDGETDEGPMRQFSSALPTLPDECKTLRVEQVLAKAWEMGQDLGEQAAKAFFADLREACEKAGTAVDGGGKPFDPHMIANLFETMDIEFDEHGLPDGYMLVVSPELGQDIARQIPAWERDSELAAQMQRVMGRKREEARVREANRRLVG